MRTPSLLLLLGPTLAASAMAQEAETAVDPEPRAMPVEAVDASSASASSSEAVVEERLVENPDGEVTIQPVILDDSVPLPRPAVAQPGSSGDSILEPASGNPYFLGFAGGDYFPPDDEILDPALVAAAGETSNDLRPDDMTYGYVMFSKRITEERVDLLRALGCRVLGFHPHHTMKVAVPSGSIGDVSVLDFVRWVGVAPAELKLHPAMAGELAELVPGVRAQVYVSVFESDLTDASTFQAVGNARAIDPGGVVMEDAEANLSRVWRSNGWMQSGLEELGVEVMSYAPRQHAFRVLVDPARIDEITARDFVHFVEPVPELVLHAAPTPHDESTAVVMSDAVRGSIDGGTNEVAVVGIVDSGVETAHTDLGIWGYGWNCTNTSTAWDDAASGGDGHGTHVAGTILGRGVSDAGQTGNAPGLARASDLRLFNYRRFPNPCSVDLDTITSVFGSSVTYDGVTTPRPHVVNNSWGSSFGSGATPRGTEFSARVADDACYDHDQLWVFSAGNSGPSAGSVSIEASAKNVLTVGNAINYVHPTAGDPGELWTSSSRGPVADNRWKPNVVAPGRWIRSCLADDSDGYGAKSGTSMAAPHVTGAAALLTDGYSLFRYAPERLTAHLMGTAMTKDDQSITTPTSSHLDTYGAGRVNVYKAMNNLGGNTWLNYGFELDGSAAYADFTVPSGCTRLVAVMSCIEESASSGASRALVNDYDFYLDQAPIDPALDTGEWFAQQSAVDNSEIRILVNPTPGSWRWKVFPDSVSSNTKIGVTLYFIVDDTTPDSTLTLTASDSFVRPNHSISVSAQIEVDDYVASAVVLDKGGSSSTIVRATTTLRDGIVTDLTDNPSQGQDIVLGDVSDVFPRTGTWIVQYATEGVKTFSVNARSDNMIDKSASVAITVDGTDPSLVGNLTSPSHTEGEWSNDPTIRWTWTPATDATSGLQGYGIYETTSSSPPASVLDLGQVTSYTSPAHPTSNSGRYFNIKAVDVAGNWDNEWASVGPYYIDVTRPSIPASFVSTSHPLGGERCEDTVTVRWSGASDAHSGVAGYGIHWSTSSTGAPATSLDTVNPEASANLAPGTWYLHVRTVDHAGNWSSGTAHFGPYTVTDTCGTNFCVATSNSSGQRAWIRALGTDDASQNDLRVQASRLPANTVGFFLAAPSTGLVTNPGGSQGNLCLGGGIGRYSATVLDSGAAGRFSLQLDLTAVPTPTGSTSMAAGTTYHWQAWFRDANPSATSNLTNGLGVLFY